MNHIKVLWCINIALNVVNKHFMQNVQAASGSWLNSMYELIKSQKSIKLGVVCLHNNMPNMPEKRIIDNTSFYMCKPKRYIVPGTSSRGKRHIALYKKLLLTAVDDFEPDVVHVHGTEMPWGYLCAQNSIKYILSLQGIMAMQYRNAWGEKNAMQMFREYRADVHNILHMCPELWKKSIYKRRMHQEKIAVNKAEVVIGRTLWDKSFVQGLHPDAKYRHIDEIMRKQFYYSKWQENNADIKWIYTAGRYTYAKGMHIIILAVSLLKERYPELSIAHAGAYSVHNAEYKALNRLAEKVGVRDRIQFCGHLNADEQIMLMKKCILFSTASFVENGCNVLQEAQLMGMPCVVTYAGGMTTTAVNEETALMSVVNNEYMMADQISRIIEDRKMRRDIAATAYEVAHNRNNPATILIKQMKVYEEIMKCK